MTSGMTPDSASAAPSSGCRLSCCINAKINAVGERPLRKFDVVDRPLADRNEEFVTSAIHEDFFLLREKGLVTRDKFIKYVASHDEVGHDNIEVRELTCLFEDENSLVWQDRFRVTALSKIIITITHVIY